MIRTRIGAADNCGDYPAASSFAAQPGRPLLPDENARYLAAAAVYNACKQTAVGAPQSQCPPGSSFQGGQVGNGPWQGTCVSVYTGQSVTGLITGGGAPAIAAPPAAAPSSTYNPFSPRGSSSGPPAPLPPRYQGRAQAGPPSPPPPADPGGIGSDPVNLPGGHDSSSSSSFLDSIPTWAKWAAAGGAVLFLFSGKK